MESVSGAGKESLFPAKGVVGRCGRNGKLFSRVRLINDLNWGQPSKGAARNRNVIPQTLGGFICSRCNAHTVAFGFGRINSRCNGIPGRESTE